jgi:hypothetical protein
MFMDFEDLGPAMSLASAEDAGLKRVREFCDRLYKELDGFADYRDIDTATPGQLIAAIMGAVARAKP